MKLQYYIKHTLLIIGLFFLLFYLIGQIKITAEFENLEPFQHRLPIYYKGYHLGHTSKIYPSEDFKTTYVDFKLRMRNLRLPENCTAVVRRKDRRDYVELIYPKEPHIKELKHNSIIKGSKGLSFEKYLEEQSDNGGFDEIRYNLNNSVLSLGTAFEAIAEMAQVLTEILQESKPSLVEAAKNLNQTTKNLANASGEIDKTLQEGYLKNTFINLETSSKDISLTTSNLNKETSKRLNCVLDNTNVVIKNINEIVVGIGCTLKKRFGGIRLLFGKTDCK